LMAHVLIENGVVVQVDMTERPPEEFVEAPDGVVAGWTYVGGRFSPAVVVPNEADYATAIQRMMDTKAAEHRYDSLASAISYRGDPNPTFAAEADVLFAWRSAVWTYSSAQLALVTAGARSQPAISDFLSEVIENCPFSWPS
jgi:hypothetical protein